MTSQHTKSNIISSLFWKLMERGGAQGIQLAVQIVLARMLAPEQFGTIAIVMVFVNLAQVFVHSGFGTALIQKKDADSEDFSSVFYLSLAVAGVSYVIIFICAPYIALSAHQDNQKRVKEMMRRAVVSSSFIVFPMMIGMAAVAEPLVRIVLTDKWLPVVPFMQIFCFLYILTPVHTANLQAINAMGRSDVFLRLEMINKTTGLVILGASLPFGVYAIAAGQVFAGIISSFVNAWPNKELLGYSYKEQLLDIFPALLISALMGAAVYMLGFLDFAVWQRLAVQVICGILIYTALARLFKIESYIYLRDTMKQLVRGRNDRE